MPLWVHVDVDYRPDLGPDELLAIMRDGLGDKFEVYKPGRFQVPDVMVKRSESDGVAVKIRQQRHRKRTRLRVYPMAPSIALRPWRPVGLARQASEPQPLVDEVVLFLEESPSLRNPEGGG